MGRLSTAALIGLFAAASGCGKGAEGDCPQLDICGGSPVGNWKVVNVCQVFPVRPAQTADVVDFTTMTPPLAPTIAPPQPNPVVSPQTTSGDWCSSLVYNPDDSVSNANLWHEAPALAAGSTMSFGMPVGNAPGDYLTTLIFQVPKGQDFTHFAPVCLRANGAMNPTCDKLSAALKTFYKPTTPTVPATFSDITCSDATDGGCDCTYTFTVQVDDTGTWIIDPMDDTVLIQDSAVLTFNAQPMNAAAPTTTLRSSLCHQQGQPLELSGLRGGSLSNVQGLRTMALAPM
jgi:hypothetical protein